LWGRDNGGRFATIGRSAAATVRGTRWLTEDTCAGTRVSVDQGAVVVRPTGKGRAVTVRAHHSRLVRAT
jgi:ferric-dicitrate binding protein FerR (iron transport regulator)